MLDIQAAERRKWRQLSDAATDTSAALTSFRVWERPHAANISCWKLCTPMLKRFTPSAA